MNSLNLGEMYPAVKMTEYIENKLEIPYEALKYQVRFDSLPG